MEPRRKGAGRRVGAWILAEGDETIPACVRAALTPLVRQLDVLDWEIARSDRTIQNSMPELNQLLSALFLVALVLYLMSAVLRLDGSAERRRWFQRAATTMIGIAMAIAVVATVKWFIR